MLSLYVGIPGSGKSSVGAHAALKALRKGIPVWSNTPIVGTYKITADDIGKLHIQDGLLIIDEAGIEFNNRNFKDFKQYQTEFFKLHRHYNMDVMVLSQNWEDMDKKIRDLAARVYIVHKVPLLPLAFTREVKVKIGIDDTTHKLMDLHYMVHPLLGGLKFYWLRKAWKSFNSYEAPQLEHSEFEKYRRKKPKKKKEVRSNA